MRVRELTIAYRPHPSGAHIDGRSAATPKTAAAILSPILEHEPSEVFVVLLLDVRKRLLAVHEVARGGITATQVDCRVILRAALLANAPAVILAHNHPSGDPAPSTDDLALTARLAAAGSLLDIDVLDHIIIGDHAYLSFKETGRL